MPLAVTAPNLAMVRCPRTHPSLRARTCAQRPHTGRGARVQARAQGGKQGVPDGDRLRVFVLLLVVLVLMVFQTSIKDAIKNFEAKSNLVAAETEKVLLYGQLPPIAKMDNTLGTLKACKHLALSSNTIEKITGLKGLDSLEVLSLGRNQIKKLDGLDDVAATLRELWMSYNLVDKLNGMEKLSNLVVLYMSNNMVAKWSEFDKFKETTKLEELLFVGNPIHEAHKDTDYRFQVAGRIPWLKKLDGTPIDDDERAQGAEIVAG